MSERDIFTADPGELGVAILVLPGSGLLSFAATIEPMQEANRRADGRVFRWRLFSDQGGEVILGSTLSIATEPLQALAGCDLLIVVAGRDPTLHAGPSLIAGLARIAPGCRAICGVEGGTWILARAGLLNGQTATTQPEDLEEFADVFPEISVVADRFAISGRYLSVSGAAAMIELMLELILNRLGPELADGVAQQIGHGTVAPADRRNAPVAPKRLDRDAPKLARAIGIMGDSLDRPLDATGIAGMLGMSRRGLELMFRKHLGQTPMAYFLRLRLKEARRLVLETAASAGEVSSRTGFSSPAAFARAFRREFGMSASALRRLYRR